MPATRYDYPVLTVDKVIDGDTVDVTVIHDAGFRAKIHLEPRIRLAVIDAPETGSAEARRATFFLTDWCRERGPWLRIATYKEERRNGRWIGDLYDHRTGETASEALLAAGLAVLWG